MAVAATGAAIATAWSDSGSERDELMVLGPFGVGGDEPWVLGGGVSSLLGQLDYDHKTRAQMLKTLSSKRINSGREQQLEEEEEMDPDDPVSN